MKESTVLAPIKRSSSRIPASELVQRARALVPTLRARAERTERERRVPAETIEMLRDAELFRTLQPARFGGFEHGFVDLLNINYELGQGCGSAAWCASFGMTHQWFVSCFPIEAQEEVWKNPDNIVAGSYQPNGKFELAPGGYTVSGGRWSFASNCDNSEWYILGGLLPVAEGSPERRPAMVLVPREQARIEDTWFTVGLAGTGSNTVVIDEPVFVPSHRTMMVSGLPEDGVPGPHAHTSAVYRTPFFSTIPIALISPALGIVRGALDEFLQAMKDRTPRAGAEMGKAAGANPLAQFPHIQSRVAEASAAIDAAYLLLRRDLEHVEDILARGKIVPIETRIRNRRDHAYAARLAVSAVNALFEAVGANGLNLSSGIQRAWRDVNAIGRHIGLNWDTVGPLYGQQQFGLEPKGMF